MNTMIKNVDEENWHFLKVEAAKEKMTLGEMFNRVVEEYKESGRENNAKAWKAILSAKPLLTKKEAKEMHERTKKAFRSEYGFEG